MHSCVAQQIIIKFLAPKTVNSTEILFIREADVNQVHYHHPHGSVTLENIRTIFNLIIMQYTTITDQGTKVLLTHAIFRCMRQYFYIGIKDANFR